MDFTTTFDTRDLIEYIDNLKESIIDSYNFDQRTALGEDCIEAETWEEVPSEEAYKSELDQLRELLAFAEELSVSPDYEYGETVIPEYEFTDYVHELVEDCGYSIGDLPWWISDAIDWNKVADNVRMDYNEAKYQGITYLIRA